MKQLQNFYIIQYRRLHQKEWFDLEPEYRIRELPIVQDRIAHFRALYGQTHDYRIVKYEPVIMGDL